MWNAVVQNLYLINDYIKFSLWSRGRKKMYREQFHWTFMIRIVLVDPEPSFHPVTTIIASPDLIIDSFFPKSIPAWIRRSTSLAQSSIFGWSNKYGNKPRYKWAWRATDALRVMVIIGQRGRYFEIKWADRPVVVKTMIATVFDLRDASTVATATDVFVSHGIGVFKLSSINTLWWKIE